jgi:mono/diheme cytochrome c family protein
MAESTAGENTMTKHRKPLFVSLMVSLGVLVLVNALSGEAEPNRDGPAQFKSPLDVTVDEKGETAKVLLGTRGIATVDLETGEIRKDMLTDQRMPHPARASFHYDYLPPRLREFYTRLGGPDPADTDRPPGGYASVRGASNERGMCWTPQGRARIAVHQMPRTHVPATQVAQNWVFTNVFSLLYPGVEGEIPYMFCLDEPTRAYADPADVVIRPDGKVSFIACAGADTVLAIDWDRLHAYTKKDRKSDGKAWKLAPYPHGGAGLDDTSDLTASRHYVVAKLPTQTNPRRLGISGDGKTLVVSNYLADSLTVIDAVNLKLIRHISLGDAKPGAARRGEILFNSAKMTFHGQFTCASCHPGGHADGLVWDLERDGVGNYKKTKSLLGVRDTAPYGWHGSSPTLADRVTGTLRKLHRHEPTEQEVDDLVAYLKSLPPPRPKPVKLAEVEAVARGKALFQGKADCVKCHRGDTLQDGKTHDIGTRGPTDTQDAFDTPSLLGVSDNAPYLHDGRAETLEEVFKRHNSKKQHGAAHLLSTDELSDLIAYLKHL